MTEMDSGKTLWRGAVSVWKSGADVAVEKEPLSCTGLVELGPSMPDAILSQPRSQRMNFLVDYWAGVAWKAVGAW